MEMMSGGGAAYMALHVIKEHLHKRGNRPHRKKAVRP